MNRAVKFIPVIFVIFIVSTISVILISNLAGQVDFKERVIRVERTIEVGDPIIDKFDKNVKEVMISRDWLSGVNYFSNKQNLKDLYAKETLYPGDIIRADRVGKMNQIVSLEIKPEYERIAIAIEKPYYALNYQMNTGDYVALDCTVDGILVKKLNISFKKKILLIKNNTIQSQGSAYTASNDSYIMSLRIVERVKIISFCDKNGKVISDEERQKSSNKDICSVIIDTSFEDAMIIQMLRGNKAVFEISKLSKESIK